MSFCQDPDRGLLATRVNPQHFKDHPSTTALAVSTLFWYNARHMEAGYDI